MSPDPRIIKFLKKHHVLTVCSTVDDEPWCANCFYVYLEDENAFVFTSGSETRHGREFLLNSSVAGSVVLETRIIGKIQGVQFRGTVTIAEGERLTRAERAYVKRFPVAALMDTHLWFVDLTLLKMTDNLLGFGKKLIWEQPDNR
jgi:uncharacterized protein